jgi:hypothetical protein
LSRSASHAEATEAHAVTSAVTTAAVHVVTTEVHAAMTEAQEVHVATVVKSQLRTKPTTSQRCSNISD